ncbi:MAG: hypothetical protein IJK63_12230 [Oscillospiraceae bacterium]|nr:hypothetical protein [Oscillospiraceae bacterium]
MKRVMCTILIVFLLFSAVTILAYADAIVAGTVVGGNALIIGNLVNFRQGPATSYASNGLLLYGDTGALTHAYPSYPYPSWYRMRIINSSNAEHIGSYGWVNSAFVTATNVSTPSSIPYPEA